MPYYNSRGALMPESGPEQGRIAGTSAGGETLQAGPGNISVSGEGGGDTLIGSSGDNRFWSTHPADRIIEQPGGGIDTLTAWAPTKLPANVENLVVNGAFNYAVGNELDNLIIVDDFSHWVYGAGGDDVLVGGPTQRTTYMIRAGEGSDVIYNWNVNSQIQLHGYGLNTAAQIRSAMTQQGSDVVLRLSSSETLTFRNTTLSAFEDRQFLLPVDTSKLGAITFQDEFDSLKLYDFANQTGQWRADFGGNLKDQWAYTLVSNGEHQMYVKPGYQGLGEADLDYNPFSINNGILTITASRIDQEDFHANFNRNYVSGMLNTIGIFEQKYGYFEIRAELPTAIGTWPAFWMIPTPTDGSVEGDIMEALAATPHYHYSRALGGSETIYDNAYKIDPSGFHTYGMLWTPTSLTFYYDGVAVLTGRPPSSWTEPMSLIVNLAVGGWGGDPDPSAFPANLRVDYIRAYALADGSSQVIRTEPEAPVGTLRAAGGASEAPIALTFQDSGQPLTSAKIIVGSRPANPGPEKAFVIWEDGGAVFGAVWNGSSYGPTTALMAGTVSWFTGTGTWLTSGKVAVGYMKPDGAGKAAWALVFDPVRNTFTRQELGPATGDLDFVATNFGGFAVSWDAPDGSVMGRYYDEYAYGGDIPGWYGPARQLAGDLSGFTASGKLIAGGQAYTIVGASQSPGGGGGNNAGDDNMSGSRLFGGLGNDTLVGTAGQDYLRGEEGNDRLIGGDAFDDLHGNMGDDFVYGGGGDDWVVGGKDQDQLFGEEGHDVVLGNMGADTLDGGAGNDVVRGGQGDDRVVGGWGDDWIAGDRANDTLSGGAGADIFHAWAEAGIDIVTDFNRAEGDRVNLLPGTTYSLRQEGADTVIDLGGGNRMVLQNVQLSSLDAGWIFGA